jgi:hypothetical protein
MSKAISSAGVGLSAHTLSDGSVFTSDALFRKNVHDINGLIQLDLYKKASGSANFTLATNLNNINDCITRGSIAFLSPAANGTNPRASPTNVSTGAASATSLGSGFLDVGESGASKEKSQDKHHSTAKTSMKTWLRQEENKLKQYENDAEALSLQRIEVEMRNQ